MMKSIDLQQAPAARRNVLGAFALMPLALARCSTGSGQAGTTDDLLGAHGLDGLTEREIIETLEALPLGERPTDLMASVRPANLVVSDAAGREVTLPLPEDQFYLSVAPYVDTTHECHFHSLTTCTGELRSQDVEVLVTVEDSGTRLEGGTVTTHPNGFLGLWLPRGPRYSLTCAMDGASGEATVSTSGDDDPTCLTTLGLA